MRSAIAETELGQPGKVTLLGGLTSAEAVLRLRRFGRNELQERSRGSWLKILGRQVKSPLILLLVFAAIVSAFVSEWLDATIVLLVIIASSILGFAREFQADRAAEKLQRRLQSVVKVVRDGTPVSVAVGEIVPGDVVLLSAGRSVPADGLVLEAADFFVSESILTGESFPVLKTAADNNDNLQTEASHHVFMGTNVRSGSARCLITATARTTMFGQIAHRLIAPPPETSFERGLRRFSALLSVSMICLTFFVFVANMFFGRSLVSTLLFSIALAVGLSPELLPAILNLNLSRSTRILANRGVLVRRLNAIENLGSIDVLCTDKTGTLTEGVVQVEGSYDCLGRSSSGPLEFAGINAALGTGLDNPLDDAILTSARPATAHLEKISEIPFDSIRKRVTVLARTKDGYLLITKGALNSVASVSTLRAGNSESESEAKTALANVTSEFAGRGMRIVAVATKTFSEPPQILASAECDMRMVGFITFFDRPKPHVGKTIARLKELGIAIKIITGDSSAAAKHIGTLVGTPSEHILAGDELQKLTEDAFSHIAERTDIFAEVDANQKERIILALKKRGHVVGFLGDGVNDASSGYQYLSG